MANHFQQILKVWLPDRDNHNWVLATIVATEGSSYRKIGAQMLINDLGQYYGLLSGGCLESDIMIQARRCWDNNQNRLIQYDMREEEDLAWKLGIGCGGLVKILLQPVNAANNYLDLHTVLAILNENGSCLYSQMVIEGLADNTCRRLESVHSHQVALDMHDDIEILTQTLRPPFHLAIFGGGIDAKPVVDIAASIGWQITLIDSRTTYARKEHFAKVDQIVKKPIEQISTDVSENAWLQSIDAVILMNHNVELDALSLSLVQQSSSRYLGILGPTHRTDRVFEEANLTRNQVIIPLANPIGLRLGGELPESIALSMISEIHAFLENADAQSISDITVSDTSVPH